MTATERFPLSHCPCYKCNCSCHCCYQYCCCYYHYHHKHCCHNPCCCPRACERERLSTVQKEEEWKEEEYDGRVGWKVDNSDKEGYTRQEWEEEAAKLEKWLE